MSPTLHYVVDMEKEFQKVAFDLIGVVALGVDFQSQWSEHSEYEKAWQDILAHAMWMFYVPLPYWCWRFLSFIPSQRRFDEGIKLMDSVIYESIKQCEDDGLDEDNQSFLARMMREARRDDTLRKWLTHNQIRNEMITLLFAGHDTTTQLLTWSLVRCVIVCCWWRWWRSWRCFVACH